MNNYNLKIEDIDYNKLLNREPIIVDNIKTQEYLKNKKILISGGCGSIGSEIVKQLLNLEINNLIIQEPSYSSGILVHPDRLRNGNGKGIVCCTYKHYLCLNDIVKNNYDNKNYAAKIEESQNKNRLKSEYNIYKIIFDIIVKTPYENDILTKFKTRFMKMVLNQTINRLKEELQRTPNIADAQNKD